MRAFLYEIFSKPAVEGPRCRGSYPDCRPDSEVVDHHCPGSEVAARHCPGSKAEDHHLSESEVVHCD